MIDMIKKSKIPLICGLDFNLIEQAKNKFFMN